MKFAVNFSISYNYEQIVEADTADDARKLVEDGLIDYDIDDYNDCGEAVINNIRVYEQPEWTCAVCGKVTSTPHDHLYQEIK